MAAYFDHEESLRFLSDAGKISIKCEDGNGFNVKWEKEGENVYIFEIFDKFPENLKVDVISRRSFDTLEMLDVNKYKLTVDLEKTNIHRSMPEIDLKSKLQFKKAEIPEQELIMSYKLPARIKSMKLGEIIEKSITLGDGIEIDYSIAYVINGYDIREFKITIKSKTHDLTSFNPDLTDLFQEYISIEFMPNKFPTSSDIDENNKRESILKFRKCDFNSDRNEGIRRCVYLKERIPVNAFQEKVDNHGEKTDVKITSNDGKIIYVHKKVLECKSEIFKALFKNRENEGFPFFELDLNYKSEIIQRAMAYFYEVIEGIDGHEIELIKFAEEYRIQELKKICVESLETKITSKNVCEIYQIAFEFNLESLKKKSIQHYQTHRYYVDKKPLQSFTKEMLLELL